MRNQNSSWLEFGAKKSSDFGAIVTALPEHSRAVERGEWVHIPGGTPVWLGEGCFGNIKLSAEMIVPTDRREAISSWLNGSGKLRLSDRPDLYRPARASALTFERSIPRSNLCRAKISFEAHPFCYMHGEQPLTMTTPGLIENLGTVESLPTIHLYGNGDITLMVGGKTLLLHNITGNISIDSSAKIAHSNAMLATSQLYGDWPIIPPGGCAVSWTGNVTSVVIQRNQRLL